MGRNKNGLDCVFLKLINKGVDIPCQVCYYDNQEVAHKNNRKKHRRLKMDQFIKETSARGYSSRTVKASAIVLGDNGKYWVVTLAKMEQLLKEGFEVIK